MQKVGSGPLIKTYSELITIPTFEGRVRYLQLWGVDPFVQTFGDQRYVNQGLYHSRSWKKLRRDIILRDNGNDLAFEGRPILDKIMVHHINPLRIEDFELGTDKIFDPENLVCVSYDMHNIIHYAMGPYRLSKNEWVPRSKNDTIPWR